MLVIRLLRLHHWIKNLFLFIPIFFAGDFFNVEKLIATFIVFIAFGFAASTIYILNDINDVEEDRAHPENQRDQLLLERFLCVWLILCLYPVLHSLLALATMLG